MNTKRTILLMKVVALAFVLTASVGWAAAQGKSAAKKSEIRLPAAVAQAIRDNRPDAEIDKLEVEKEGGVDLYDIEFKAGKGEIEVAEDGTVMDIATIIEAKDVPKAALAAIQKAASGASIGQIEKSEVRAELKVEGGKGKIVKLSAHKYVYEAELLKGKQKAEVQVDPDGKVVEAPKWGTKEKESDEKGEKGERPAKPKPALEQRTPRLLLKSVHPGFFQMLVKSPPPLTQTQEHRRIYGRHTKQFTEINSSIPQSPGLKVASDTFTDFGVPRHPVGSFQADGCPPGSGNSGR